MQNPSPITTQPATGLLRRYIFSSDHKVVGLQYFFLSLAAVLVGIGILVVTARGWIDRIPSGGPILKRLPIASAAAVTLIGAILVFRAFQGAP